MDVAAGFDTDGDLFAFSLTSRLLIEYLTGRGSAGATVGFVSNVSFALDSFSCRLFSCRLLGSTSFNPLVRRVTFETSWPVLVTDGSTDVALVSGDE